MGSTVPSASCKQAGMWYLVFIICIVAARAELAQNNRTAQQEREEREERVLSVFNVVTFPNSACGATNGYNGTCYTSSECTSKGGTASGTCASSFGVCCVFSISCGATSSANNSYAVMSSYSVSSDADPCTYTFCKTNTDVCKLRIDFDTMVLADPYTTTTFTQLLGAKFGDCMTDTLTVTNPNGIVPPTICGYNTGQHMWVPASDQCNEINIDIDTGTTTTTRKWQIKVTQYECGNLMMPVQDCLQYHTATTGTIASFNWDTSSSTVATSQAHLSNQYYAICMRRSRSYCKICYSPVISETTSESSFGLGANAVATTMTATVGSYVSGITTVQTTAATIPTAVGWGDYLEIMHMQPAPGTNTVINPAPSKISGHLFGLTTTHITICSFAIPFRVGVHFDADESIALTPASTALLSLYVETHNFGPASGGALGTRGFYLNYFQGSC